MSKEESGRQHRATFCKDKFKGGFNVRVVGPNANRFAGRTVPVLKRDQTEDEITLEELLHSGIDDGEVIPGDKGKPYAIYRPEKRAPRDADEEIPF